MLNVMTFSNDMRPALYSEINIAYTAVGLLPVGSPSTNGFSRVGWNVRIRSKSCQTLMEVSIGPEGKRNIMEPYPGYSPPRMHRRTCRPV